MDPQDDLELRQLRARMNALRDSLASVVAEEEQLRSALGAFEVRYEVQIGVLLRELDMLELSIASYRRRISALSQPVDTWLTEEEAISREFRAEKQRIEDEYAETSRAELRSKTLPPEPPEDVAEQIRRIYRKLARMHHPDLAATDEARIEAEAYMKRINSAMESRDLDELRRLEADSPQSLETTVGETRQERIAWMLAEIRRLESALADAVSAIARLKSSSTHEIWNRWRNDPNTLDRLESNIQTQIRYRSAELNALINSYCEKAGRQIAEDHT